MFARRKRTKLDTVVFTSLITSVTTLLCSIAGAAKDILLEMFVNKSPESLMAPPLPSAPIAMAAMQPGYSIWVYMAVIAGILSIALFIVWWKRR